MVSFKKVAFTSLVMCSAANAQLGLIINQVTKQAVHIGAQFRMPSVSPEKATSELQYMMSVPMNYPAIKNLMNKGVQAMIHGHTDDQHASSLLNEAIKVYNDFSRGPQFKPYSAYMKQHMKDFDIKKAERVIVSRFQPYSARLDGPINQFLNDPQGKKMGSTAVSLVKHIASDFGAEQYLSEIPQWQKYAKQLGA